MSSGQDRCSWRPQRPQRRRACRTPFNADVYCYRAGPTGSAGNWKTTVLQSRSSANSQKNSRVVSSPSTGSGITSGILSTNTCSANLRSFRGSSRRPVVTYLGPSIRIPAGLTKQGPWLLISRHIVLVVLISRPRSKKPSPTTRARTTTTP